MSIIIIDNLVNMHFTLHIPTGNLPLTELQFGDNTVMVRVGFDILTPTHVDINYTFVFVGISGWCNTNLFANSADRRYGSFRRDSANDVTFVSQL